jgi:hypothetical protein
MSLFYFCADNQIVNQNGVQYRVVNQGGIPQGMQLVTSTSGFHLVSPQGQARPVIFQQQKVRGASPQQSQNRQPVPAQQNQQFVLRTVSPSVRPTGSNVSNTVLKQGPVTMLNRSQSVSQVTAPRLPSAPVNASNNGQVVIPRNQYNTPASATVPSPSKKFTLVSPTHLSFLHK